MPAGGAVTAGVISALPGIVSLFGGGGDDDEAAAKARANALAQFTNLSIPDIELQKIALEQYTSAGKLTPELMEAIQIGNSGMSNIKTNPIYQKAKQAALEQQLQRSKFGMTPEDKMQYNQIALESSRRGQAAQAAIGQKEAERGISSAGSDLAARRLAAQNAGNEANAQSDRVAAASSAAASKAAQDAGMLAGSMQTQDFNEKAAIEQQNDAISKFNAQNAQDATIRNMNIKNEIARLNLENEQNIRNRNTATSQEQEKYNKGLLQQRFENQYKKAYGSSQALSGQAKAYADSAAATRKQYGDIASGVSKGVQAGMAYTPSSGGSGFDANEGAYNTLYGGGNPTDDEATTAYNTLYGGSNAYGLSSAQPASSRSNPVKRGPTSTPSNYDPFANKSTDYFAHGGEVPGEPVVECDSEVNDTVDAKLSPGEIVIPRSIAQSNDMDIILDFVKSIKRHRG